jgi:hypothetical protein
MSDLILAAAGGYSWNNIDVWAISLRASGYEGDVGVVLYDNPNNPRQETKINIENLSILGIQVFLKPLSESIYNQRFDDFYQIIRSVQDDLRYVIVTDIRDVLFQTNPVTWLEENLSKKLYAVSEGILYQNEPWGRDNVIQGFPTHAPRLLENCIYNVGVLAGEARMVADICLATSMMAKASGFPIADQSGYNFLLDMEAYKDAVQYGKSEDGFTCMAGTFSDPTKIDAFRPNLLEPEPYLDVEGVKTNSGKLFSIVHQYDRVPAWNLQLRQDLNNKIHTT